MKSIMDIFTYIWDILWIVRNLEGYRRPLAYGIRHGKGNMVLARLSSGGQCVDVRLLRKIVSKDVKNGQLLPVVRQEVVRRGGKRVTQLFLSPRATEDLALVLTEIARVTRRRRRADQLFSQIEALTLAPEQLMKRFHIGRPHRS